ncbi:hypothetical protein JCM12178A_20000 [Salidesulfovibrio brasiliensis]
MPSRTTPTVDSRIIMYLFFSLGAVIPSCGRPVKLPALFRFYITHRREYKVGMYINNPQADS